MNRHRSPRSPRQRGVAALTIVLVLFFIVSMVAAYTSRNLIFEQRTAANQYRSTQAMEAAQAGLEWAKSMLNHGSIDQFCQTSTVPTDTTFRQRYLTIDASGSVAPLVIATPTLTPADQLTPSCVFNGSDWDCSCPTSAAPSLATPTGTGIFPAFRVRMVGGAGLLNNPPVPGVGVVRIESVGCTKLDLSPTGCMSFVGQGATSEGRAVATELLGLTGGLPSPPLAALTSGGSVNLGGMAMAVYNADLAAGGTTIQSRLATAKAGLVLSSVPGTPGDASTVENDASLPDPTTAAGARRMFSGVFNMWPDTYRQQPAAIVLDATTPNCTAAGCTALAVRNALLFNPGRVLWIEGNLDVDSAGDIGSSALPALLVVNGNLTFSTAATIYGLVYTRTGTWSTLGSGGVVRGAVVAEGNVAGSGTPRIIYDAGVLKRLRLASGSFVMVPGGWKDFCSTASGAVASPGMFC
jgi:hypothetical protein